MNRLDARGGVRLTTAARLLDTAAELFRAKGYAAASTRELSRLLGINKASLYHHIEGKEELLYGICVESLTMIHEEVRAAAFAAKPEVRVETMINRHVVSALSNRNMHAVMLTELRSLSPAHRTEVVDKRDRYEALLRTAIRQRQDEGHIRDDLSAESLTLGLLNLLNWTIFWYDPSGPLTPEELGRFLADLFLNGARPRA